MQPSKKKRFFNRKNHLDTKSRACYFKQMSKQKRATIRDVAAAAGVSVTTVSDALSGKGRLPEATREKVHALAAQLNYRPSAIARGLRGDGLGLIGICIAPAGGGGGLTDVGYWSAIVTHASQAILSAGHAPVLLPHNVEMLRKLRIPLDGAVVVDPLEHDPVMAFLQERRVHVVSVGRDLGRDGGYWVDDDNAEGIRQLLVQTVPKGSKVAFISVGPRKSYAIDALAGARAWAEEHGSMIEMYDCANLDPLGVDAVVRKALVEGSTAFIAQSDRLALRVLSVLQSLGRRIPNDIRLLAASDARELENSDPSISAVSQHPQHLAELATLTLMDLILGRPARASALVPMSLQLRATSPKL